MSYFMNTTPEARARYEARKQRDALRAMMIATQPKAPFALIVCATFVIAFCVATIAFQFV